jgi:hypothetical protein
MIIADEVSLTQPLGESILAISGIGSGGSAAGPSSVPAGIPSSSIVTDGLIAGPPIGIGGGAPIACGRKISLTMPPPYGLSDSNPSPEPMLEGYEARSLPNVLRRISSLIAMGTNVS